MLVDVLLATLLGAVLLVAAALKIADRTSTAIAAESFGLGGRAARWTWLPLAALEGLLAAGLLTGWRPAAWVAAGVLAAFAAAQAVALAAGRGGAPCGCFGARGRISWASAGRVAGLAAVALVLGTTATAGTSALTRSVGAATAVALTVVVVVRARRSGTPPAALEVAGEGPALGERIELAELPAGAVRLAFFTTDACRLCRALRPHAERLGATVYDEREDRPQWTAAAVPGAPFAIALAGDGTVLAKGTVNTGRQLESVLTVARERGGRLGHGATSRRGFLATAGAGVAAVTAGRVVGSLVAPGDADAFHFCGHVYTTDGCPHPTGLPRIDNRGFPLRGRDGLAIDDLGRLVDAQGAPIDENGAPLLDPDGRPQPPVTRTRICTAAGRRFRVTVNTDGSWYRCCDGHVRKLLDCCTPSARRINGDRALRGYCFNKRHVLCVMYVQTRVPC